MFKILPIIIAVAWIISVLATAYGAEYRFNETKMMQDEDKLLAFCISNTTIKIPEVEKFCGIHYGGLNTTYGKSLTRGDGN